MRVFFDSFWGKFNKQNNIFVWILSKITDVEVTPDNPDLIFTDNRNYRKSGKAKVIYFSGEPFFNIGECDYALTSFDVHDDKRFFRLPLYTLYAYDIWQQGLTKSYDAILTKEYSKKVLLEKNKFCCYISQGGGGNCPREALVKYLDSKIRIDCVGNHLNNHPIIPGEPGTIEGSIHKIEFLKQYKFALAIENNDSFGKYFGYTTEKIFEPMVAGCIPIYWGNPNINLDFNKYSFLNVKNYENYENLFEHMVEINSNSDLFIEYLMQPYVTNNKFFDINYLIEIFYSFLD
jgi:hypothetical protein